MGLLNSKSRIFDTILTQEGRRQIANGQLRVEFFSFTDSGVFYNQDTTSGSNDVTQRIALEASCLPQDQLAFEADDSGKLMPFKGSEVPISNGKIINFVTGILGSVRNEVVEVDDAQFASLSSNLLGSSIQNFNKLYMIGSPDLFDETRNEFLVSKNVIDFAITNDRPISSKQISTLKINHVESFFQDKRFSHVPNFYYLPPVNKAKIGTRQCTGLGEYTKLGQKTYFEYNDLKIELDQLKKIGFEQTVEFTETSKTNNLMCQFFELSNGTIVKLDIIDFGIFQVGSNQQLTEEELAESKQAQRDFSLEKQTKHVFFAGKVFKDDYGVHTFVNLFTIIFEA